MNNMMNMIMMIIILFRIVFESFLQKSIDPFHKNLFAFSLMRNTRLITLAAVLAGTMIVQSTNAQALISMPSPLGGDSLIGFSGSFGDDHRFRSFTGTTLQASLDLDLDANTVTFPSATVDINESIELSGNFDLGGQNIPITGTITYDSILNFFDDEPVPMTAGSEANQFVITDSDFELYLGPAEETRINGSYSFTGPTETVSGTFTHSPGWWQFFRSAGDGLLDTTNHPETVSLGGAPFTFIHNEEYELFNGQVDGVDIIVQTRIESFYAPTPFIIPEPSTYAFVGGICLVAFVAFRRIRISQTSQSSS